MKGIAKQSAGILADQFQVLSVLQFPAFRFFWIAVFIQVAGQLSVRFIIGWLAFDLTGSTLYLGYVALGQAVPVITFGLIGGLMADRFDQRKVLVVTQALSAAIIAALATLGIMGKLGIEHLLVAAVLLGSLQAFDNPSRLSLFPHLLPDRSHLPRAVTAIAVIFQMNQLVSPAVAGFLIASIGAHVSLYVTAVAIATMGAMVMMLPIGQVARRSEGNPVANLVAGVQYVWGLPGLRMVMALNFGAAFFALGHVLMLPAFAAAVFEVDSRGLGFLGSAAGLGAFFGIIVTPKLIRRYSAGIVTAGTVISLGLSVMAFSSVPWYPIALTLMVWVGLSAYAYLTGIDIIIQTLVPDELRGRVMALLLMRWSFVPFGATLMGVLANRFDLQLVVGGSAFVAFLCGLVAIGVSREFRALRVGGPQGNEPQAAPAASAVNPPPRTIR